MIGILVFVSALLAPSPRSQHSQPVVRYTLRVDSADLSGFQVELTIRNAPDTFRLAMASHPEYDDRYWRFVDGLRVAGGGRGESATLTREDSALWRVIAPGGEAVVRYRLRLPPPPSPEGFRAAWKPFLTPTGGLIGGPHSFLYMVGATRTPVHVTLELPPSWEIVTGLEPTADARAFSASVDELVDSPFLVGQLRTWRFALDGVPHRVVYWPLPAAAPFDTAAFVDAIQRLVRQAIALFGRAPYREYAFLFQDGAYGALEHRNSVTLGAPSADLTRDPAALLGQTAHEFFHTWNLMRIHPAEYRDVDWRPQPPVAGLWFSEGLTMFYADLLLRRAGLPTSDSTRPAHLESLIARYLASPGNARFSAESVSRVAYGAQPGALGDYSASTHLQGELLGAMLDLIVRDATNGARSMDDVMRAMLDRYSGERGFTGRDVEHTVADVCRCTVKPLFDAHVRAASAIDFDRYLRLIGLRTRVTWGPALGGDGRPAPDLRLWAWQLASATVGGGGALRLLLFEPASAWGQAGLHTGDQLAGVNGSPLTTMAGFRALLGRLRVGDTVRVEVSRPAGAWRTSVVVPGYDRPSVRIEEIPEATEQQRVLRARWLSATP